MDIKEEMSNHGYIASCLGPVVDIQLVADVYRENRFIHSRLREGILRTEITGQKAVYVARQSGTRTTTIATVVWIYILEILLAI